MGADGARKLPDLGASGLRVREAGDLECDKVLEELWLRLEEDGRLRDAKSPDMAAAMAEPEPSRGRLVSGCEGAAVPALEGIDAMSNW